jgi:hypothetical protein
MNLKVYICHNCGKSLETYQQYRIHMNTPKPCYDNSNNYAQTVVKQN